MKTVLSLPLYKLAEVCFFFFALSHGLLGVRMLVNDYIPVQRIQTLIIGCASAITAIIFATVAWAILTL
jgi:succinate dehydrogenase/fumarate reductase cytochrome b subunit